MVRWAFFSAGLLAVAAAAIVQGFSQEEKSVPPSLCKALFKTAETNDAAAVTRLVQNKGQLSFERCVDDDQMTPLMTALYYENFDAALALAKCSDNKSLLMVDSFNYNVISYAASYNNSEFVRQMIDRGVPCNIVGSHDGTFPILNAANASASSTVAVLLEYLSAEEINAKSTLRPCQNALILATIRNNAEIVQMLLEKGAQVHVFDSNSLSPLQIAAIYGYMDVLKLLLSQVEKNSSCNHQDLIFAYSSAKSLKCKEEIQKTMTAKNFKFSVILPESKAKKSQP